MLSAISESGSPFDLQADIIEKKNELKPVFRTTLLAHESLRYYKYLNKNISVNTLK